MRCNRRLFPFEPYRVLALCVTEARGNLVIECKKYTSQDSKQNAHNLLYSKVLVEYEVVENRNDDKRGVYDAV